MTFQIKSRKLHCGLRRGQVKCRGIVLKMTLVRAVAEGLLGAQPAAADADALAAAEAIGIALGINELNIFAFHAERAIGKDGEFSGHVFELWVMG